MTVRVTPGWEHTLRYWRLRAGLTQTALGAALGLTPTSISGWERGLNPIPAKRHCALSDLLGIPPGQEPWTPCPPLPSAEPDTLTYWRLRAGLTQTALGAALGLTPTSISGWERGLNPIPAKHHCALSDLLGIPPGQEPWTPCPPLPSAEPDTLTYWRLRAGLTQTALGAALGLTPTSISGWERGLNPIPAKHHCALSDLLGIPPGQEPWTPCPPLPSAEPDTLTYWRLRAGLTQTALGAALGLTPTNISGWERGLRPIPPKYHAVLSDLLGIPPGQEPWPPPPPPSPPPAPDTLAYWRLRAGLTQTALAARLGLTAAPVNAWERGRDPIPAKHHRALSDLLGIPPGQEPWPPPPSPPPAPDTLAYWRLRAGLTQTALAARLGLTAAPVNAWERGLNPIPAKHHRALSDILGIPPGQEPWPPPPSPPPPADPDRGTLAYWRLRAGLTQVALAARLGVSLTSVYAWDRGRRPIPVKRHRALSDLLGIPPGQEPWPPCPPPPSAEPDTLAYWRQRSGLTQAALATALGVAQTSVSAWERGRSPIPAEQHCALSDMLGIPPGREPWTPALPPPDSLAY